jgi:phosphocarrier protein HPr
MASITVTVGSSVGLHARPASIISDAAGELDAEVTLALPDGEPVEADSALLIMTLGASYGDQVVVSSDDEEAARAIAKLVALDLDDPSYEA